MLYMIGSVIKLDIFKKKHPTHFISNTPVQSHESSPRAGREITIVSACGQERL